MVEVVLVDDHPVVREGLRAMLSGDPEIAVVGEASSGEQALEQVERLRPDVVLADIRMPGMSGTEATRRIKAAHPETSVIILTMYDSPLQVMESLRAGAAGYLVKDASREMICHAIKAVVEGETIVRSALLQQAVQGLSRKSRDGEQGRALALGREPLTTRELEVLRLVTRGYQNKQIARELSLAEVTVKKYVQSLIAKLGASDRTQAAVLGVRLGLVDLDLDTPPLPGVRQPPSPAALWLGDLLPEPFPDFEVRQPPAA